MRPVAAGLRRWAGRLTGRGRPEAVILAYHRVAEPRSDPFHLAVSPVRFAEHLEVLRSQASPISLDKLVAAMGENAVPRRSVVITFDDGYADNLLAGLPALETAGLMATFFIASGHIGRDRGFWWDEMGDLLLKPGTLPSRIDLELGGETIRADLGALASFGIEEAVRHDRWTWNAPSDPTPRHRLYRRLYPVLQRLDPDRQEVALDTLRAWVGSAPDPGFEDRTMTEPELIRFAASDLVAIGGHTHRHAMLTALSPASQRLEIAEGKTWLEERLGRRLDHLSYPYGRLSPETAAIAREVGFAAACSTVPTAVTRSADRFDLPRICPENWDGDEFARRLQGWFAD